MYVGYDCNGIVRVWGTTEKECELAREEYLNNKSKLWVYKEGVLPLPHLAIKKMR